MMQTENDLDKAQVWFPFLEMNVWSVFKKAFFDGLTKNSQRIGFEIERVYKHLNNRQFHLKKKSPGFYRNFYGLTRVFD